MRTFLLILLSSLSLGAAPFGFNQERIGGTNLVGWWRMEVTNNVADESGFGSIGTRGNSILLTNGVAGSALAFDGNTSFISLSRTSIVSGLAAMTVSVWCNFPSAPNNGAILFCSTPGSATTTRLAFGYDANGYPRIGGRLNDGGSFITATNTARPGFGMWNLWTMIYTNGSALFYTNGNFSFSNSLAIGTIPSTNSLQVSIGGNGTAAGSSIGSIDDFRIYNRALTAEEIKSLYNGGAATQQ